MRRFLCALVSLAPGVAAAQGTPRPQLHETNLDFRLTVAAVGAASVLEARYTLTPNPLQEKDPVVPELRRFVRRPSTLWGRVARDGHPLQTITGAHLGGRAYFLGERLTAAGELGLELDDTRHDDREKGYGAVPVWMEIGGRVWPRGELAGYARVRGVGFARTDDSGGAPDDRRSGQETQFGGVARMATADDRWLLALSVGSYRADWIFAGVNAGPLTASGVRARVEASYQISRDLSFTCAAEVHRESWNNGRLVLPNMPDAFKEPLARAAVFAQGEMAMVFWFRGRLAFRVGLLGGYQGERPIYRTGVDGTLAYGGLSFGMTSRY